MQDPTKLSVNLNKIATIRNARGGDQPNVCFFANLAIEAGVFGITVHPRPDGRHIRTQDVLDLQALLKKVNLVRTEKVEFNIEGYPSEEFMQLLQSAQPDQATLVPDPPEVLTSNAGWDLVKNEAFLSSILNRLQTMGIRSSVFLDPHTWSPEQKLALQKLKPNRAELYTESFAKAFQISAHNSELSHSLSRCLSLYKEVALQILSVGVELNAGHDLNQANLGLLIQTIPEIKEVSIGHALISESLIEGMPSAIKSYLRILNSQGKL